MIVPISFYSEIFAKHKTSNKNRTITRLIPVCSTLHPCKPKIPFQPPDIPHYFITEILPPIICQLRNS